MKIDIEQYENITPCTKGKMHTRRGQPKQGKKCSCKLQFKFKSARAAFKRFSSGLAVNYGKAGHSSFYW